MSEYCRNCFNLQEEVNHLEGVSDGYAVVEMQDKAKIRELEAKVAELEGEREQARYEGQMAMLHYMFAAYPDLKDVWKLTKLDEMERFDKWQKSKSESLKGGEGEDGK